MPKRKGAKTQVCARRPASQRMTVIGAGPDTDFDLHPQCNFQSYSHGPKTSFSIQGTDRGGTAPSVPRKVTCPNVLPP